LSKTIWIAHITDVFKKKNVLRALSQFDKSKLVFAKCLMGKTKMVALEVEKVTGVASGKMAMIALEAVDVKVALQVQFRKSIRDILSLDAQDSPHG